MMSPETAWVGLGSNLSDPAAQISRALVALDGLPLTGVTQYSSLYRTAPIGDVDQPDFVNAVCQVHTELSPVRLLAALLELERLFGRQRDERRFGPRVLDIDLLLYGEKRLDELGLTIPHPRLHERRFVLEPLAELAPELDIPGRGPVRVLLAACLGQAVQRIGPPQLDTVAGAVRDAVPGAAHQT